MGKARTLWNEAEATWPTLQQFLASCFHEDRLIDEASPEVALDEAVADSNLERRKAVAKEWWDWNARVGWNHDPRRQIGDGLGVKANFETSDDARQFMNMIYDKLIVSIRSEAKGWKP